MRRTTNGPVSAAVLALTMAVTVPAQAEVVVTMNQVDINGVGMLAGEVKITESPYGLVFTPDLLGLVPGLHGFHLHENPDCGLSEAGGRKVPGGAAGGHYDPDGSKAHGTPWGTGHRGDLPPLYVDPQGQATQPVLAPRLKLADLPGRALILHAGGDNHADHPAPLGGGGGRVACGVIR